MTLYFLGIDGGGTSCRMRLVDTMGSILGEAQSGSANLYLGEQVVVPQLQHCLNDILSQAHLTPDIYQNTYAVGGIAGTESPENRTWLEAYFFDFAKFQCVSDCQISCVGAFDGADGALLISGTGCIGWAVSQGKNYRVGGWGFYVSDKYSGAWVGHQAIQYALDAYDGLCNSPLCMDILTQFKNSPNTIVQWAFSATPADYGKFAPKVIQYAQQNDHIATHILQQAGQGIGDMAVHLLKKSGCDKWCFKGGLASALTAYLPTDIKQKLWVSRGDALQGAILLAQKLYKGTA